VHLPLLQETASTYVGGGLAELTGQEWGGGGFLRPQAFLPWRDTGLQWFSAGWAGRPPTVSNMLTPRATGTHDHKRCSFWSPSQSWHHGAEVKVL
jgi:hypothetical protein